MCVYAGQLGVMVFRADSSLQQTLREYVLECVFGDSEDEMEEEPATDEEALGQAERLNDRRVLLAAFLKLAMFGAIEMKYSAPIFSQYIQACLYQAFMLNHNVLMFCLSAIP